MFSRKFVVFDAGEDTLTICLWTMDMIVFTSYATTDYS
jgi:hypothetical protein